MMAEMTVNTTVGIWCIYFRYLWHRMISPMKRCCLPCLWASAISVIISVMLHSMQTLMTVINICNYESNTTVFCDNCKKNLLFCTDIYFFVLCEYPLPMLCCISCCIYPVNKIYVNAKYLGSCAFFERGCVFIGRRKLNSVDSLTSGAALQIEEVQNAIMDRAVWWSIIVWGPRKQARKQVSKRVSRSATPPPPPLTAHAVLSNVSSSHWSPNFRHI